MTSLNGFDITATVAGLTTATTLYTDGDVLGTAVFSWNLGSTPALLTNARLINATVNLAATTLFLYDRSVTAATNNTAHSVSDADRLFCIGYIDFPYPASDALGQVAEVDSIGKMVKANASNTIYGILVTRSTHTVHFGAATDITIGLSGSKDA